MEDCKICQHVESITPSNSSHLNYINQIKQRMLECPKWNDLYSHPFTFVNEISKIKDVTFGFYEILELYSVLHLSIPLNNNILYTIHFGKEAPMTIKALQYLRKSTHNHIYFVCHHADKETTTVPVDIAFCDASSENEYENALSIIKQITIVLNVQKNEGVCIIKYGDMLSPISLDIISFLSHFYEKVYITKPSICDAGSSAKYIVCKHFIRDKMNEETMKKIAMLHSACIQPLSRIYRILDVPIPLFFSGKMDEINSVFTQPRLEYIHGLLSQYDNGNSVSTNKQKTKEWCEHYLF